MVVVTEHHEAYSSTACVSWGAESVLAKGSSVTWETGGSWNSSWWEPAQNLHTEQDHGAENEYEAAGQKADAPGKRQELELRSEDKGQEHESVQHLLEEQEWAASYGDNRNEELMHKREQGHDQPTRQAEDQVRVLCEQSNCESEHGHAHCQQQEETNCAEDVRAELIMERISREKVESELSFEHKRSQAAFLEDRNQRERLESELAEEKQRCEVLTREIDALNGGASAEDAWYRGWLELRQSAIGDVNLGDTDLQVGKHVGAGAQNLVGDAAPCAAWCGSSGMHSASWRDSGACGAYGVYGDPASSGLCDSGYVALASAWGLVSRAGNSWDGGTVWKSMEWQESHNAEQVQIAGEVSTAVPADEEVEKRHELEEEIPPPRHPIYAAAEREDHLHQQEEWYQKWLRRQETRTRDIIILVGEDEARPATADITGSRSALAMAEGVDVNVDTEERRVDPSTGTIHSFAEFEVLHRAQYTAQEIRYYWRDACNPLDKSPHVCSEEHSPYENEEWYQKWLRRQKSRPRQVVEIGKPKENNVGQEQHSADSNMKAPEEEKDEDDEWYQNWVQKQARRPRNIIYLDRPQPAEEELVDEGQAQEALETSQQPEKKSYENEEWYQKWLRRQKNKPRQIIDISQKRQEAERQDLLELRDPVDQEQRPEPEKKSYDQEEWYQKWLRRQKNKGRQIIEIGGDRGKDASDADQRQAASPEEQVDGTCVQSHARRPVAQEEWYQKHLARKAQKAEIQKPSSQNG